MSDAKRKTPLAAKTFVTVDAAAAMCEKAVEIAVHAAVEQAVKESTALRKAEMAQMARAFEERLQRITLWGLVGTWWQGKVARLSPRMMTEDVTP